MPTNTYIELDKVTVSGTATSSISLNSISSSYTDLVLVVNAGTITTAQALRMTFNNDTSQKYSATRIYGTGSSTASSRAVTTDISGFYILGWAYNSTNDLAHTSVININNYSNTSKPKIILTRQGNAQGATLATSGLYNSTSAISSIQIVCTSGNITSGSTFSLYGIKAQATPGTAKATGGTITYDNFGYVYHTFTSTGTFEPLQTLSCDYAVVAGGGGGGTRWAGGGGGGGMRSTFGATGGSGSLETPISLSPNNYTVTVGGPGAGATGVYVAGSQGNSSTFSTITSIGGGGGGTASSAATTGGSGGAGGMRLGTSPAGYGAAGTSGQGYAGGNAAASGGYAGGGGGGAGAIGADADTSNFSNAGNGGAGRTIYVGGSALSLAGGGGGGSEGGGTFYGDGGLGGGGNGNSSAGQGGNGSTNTGGGGGGGGNDSGTGGSGGSGIVIIRYAGV